MTVRSVLGLALLNLFALGVGSGRLWGFRGWRSCWELAGFAYMLGTAGLGVALTLTLVVGFLSRSRRSSLPVSHSPPPGCSSDVDSAARDRCSGVRRIGAASAAVAALVVVEGEYQVVFGYRDSEREALELRRRVLAVGFPGTEILRDGCGRVRVAVDDVASREVGEEVIRQARTVDLDPTLEQES